MFFLLFDYRMRIKNNVVNLMPVENFFFFRIGFDKGNYL